MSWLLFTLACIILWSITDILYKASSPQNDPLSHYKTFVWIGIVMALAGCIMSTWSDTLLDSIKTVKDDLLYLIPLGLIYAAALFFGLLGKKHLAASVVSSLENIGGALVAIIIYYYYLLTGYILPSYEFGVLDFIATASIIIGVILIVPLSPILENPILTPAFDQMLPALFGALGVALVSKSWKIAVAPIVLMLILFIFVPALDQSMVGIMVPVGVLFTVFVARILYKKGVL